MSKKPRRTSKKTKKGVKKPRRNSKKTRQNVSKIKNDSPRKNFQHNTKAI
jgi:hypothetical protein